MSQQPTRELSMQERAHNIRQRALLYAEYLAFSRMLMSGGTIAAMTEEEWIREVRHIGTHITWHEDRNLAIFNLSGSFKPLGIFFHECISNAEVQMVWPNDRLNQ